jgi:hypothetical protein
MIPNVAEKVILILVEEKIIIERYVKILFVV